MTHVNGFIRLLTFLTVNLKEAEKAMWAWYSVVKDYHPGSLSFFLQKSLKMLTGYFIWASLPFAPSVSSERGIVGSIEENISIFTSILWVPSTSSTNLLLHRH